jgi:hypothetical protein
MSADSDLEDANNNDQNHVLLHGNFADIETSTVLPGNFGTTIYIVASHRTGSVARQYQKRIRNQHFVDNAAPISFWNVLCFLDDVADNSKIYEEPSDV